MNVTLKGLTVTGIVGSDSPHAQFVEYGTGVKGIGTYTYSLPQTGVPITGGWVYDYKKQNWQGHKSQAYLRPALDESGSAILDCYKSEGLI